MKNKFLSIGFAAISLAMLIIPIAMPSIAFADPNAINSSVFIPTILAGPLTVCIGMSGGTLPACSNLCDLVAQIANIIYYMIAVVIWIVVPILVAVGGIMIMLGGANPGMIETGKKTITGAVWGLVIVLCAWLIVFTFVGAFGNLGKYIGGFGGTSGQAACSVAGSSSGATGPNSGACGPNFGTCSGGLTCKVTNQVFGQINTNQIFGCQ